MATSRRVRKRDRKLLGLENGSGLPTWIKIRCATSLPEATAARNARAFSVGFAVSPVGNVPAPTMNRLSCANNCDIALLPILRHRKRISNDRNVRPGKPGGCACATRQINASKYASSLTNLASAPFSAASLPAYQGCASRRAAADAAGCCCAMAACSAASGSGLAIAASTTSDKASSSDFQRIRRHDGRVRALKLSTNVGEPCDKPGHLDERCHTISPPIRVP